MARSKRRGSTALRVLNILPFLPLAGRAPMYARLLWALAVDPRVPASRKALLGMAGAYIVAPIDLVPESLPIIGAMDDVFVMVLAVDVFLDGLPPALVDEKLVELGMSRAELDADLARVRRMMPRQLRAIAASVPDAIDGVAEFISQTGLERRARRVVGRIRAQLQENPA